MQIATPDGCNWLPEVQLELLPRRLQRRIAASETNACARTPSAVNQSSWNHAPWPQPMIKVGPFYLGRPSAQERAGVEEQSAR